MDLAVTHGLRREMHRLLEERQAAEAKVVEDANQLSLQFQADIINLLADWLWQYGPSDAGQDTDRQRVEAATGLSLDPWIASRGQHANLGPRDTGLMEHIWQRAGLTDQAKVEQNMESFLHGLASAVMTNLGILRETTLGPQVEAKLEQLNTNLVNLWSEHLTLERQA
ncbi:MAG: hypothetical protein HUU37_07720, partial [Bdellovibrionales bacterium]|nr:hypothetical protein [Bdellovibrionales bacterium]